MNKRIRSKRVKIEQKEIVKKLSEVYMTIRQIPDAHLDVWSWGKGVQTRTPMAFSCYAFVADDYAPRFPDGDYIPPLTASNLARCNTQLKELIK